jgi:diacylglycerol kinase (ATP)
MNQNIFFITNPISGGAKKENALKEIQKAFPNVKLAFTQHPQHATELAQNALNEGYKQIIAVGGDGTINEVAQAIIGTEGVLGIVPFGSGNGLARHLGVYGDIQKSIQVIKNQNIKLIDSCLVNQKPFLCTAGIGFDAYVSYLFSQAGTRGFSTYVKSTLSAFFKFKPEEYKIWVDGTEMNETAFSVTFANASQYGNNAYIAPNADIMDGYLDLCLLKPFSKLKMPMMGARLFLKDLPRMKEYTVWKAKKVVIERKKENFVHLDGENFMLGKRLEIEIKPKSLHVLM